MPNRAIHKNWPLQLPFRTILSCGPPVIQTMYYLRCFFKVAVDALGIRVVQKRLSIEINSVVVDAR